MQAWTSDRRLPARDRGVGPPHEFALARSRRPLVLALLDVDAIQTVSDYQSPPPATSSARCGHGLASTLRSYNAAVRWRRVRVRLSGLTREVASDRVAGNQRAPKAGGATIGAGLVDDTLESLIDRAEASVYRARGQPHQRFLSRIPPPHRRVHVTAVLRGSGPSA